tara:strand:+ start:125 stop:253 length:129 start_codon:yes stop_codon:yes gene_type:complete
MAVMRQKLTLDASAAQTSIQLAADITYVKGAWKTGYDKGGGL